MDKIEANKLKRTLPAITVSGTFEGGHASRKIKQHSGLIQMDFDAVPNPILFKELLCKNPYTYACFISPSGNGVKVIVKINPKKHLQSFESLKDYYFNNYKADIDVKCKDLGRLMFLSYDENIYINNNSEIFVIMKDLRNDVEIIVSRIEEQRIDITQGYNNWLNIGFALADSFNEDGRDYFHRVSKLSAEFDREKSNKQFTACLKHRNNGITIKTFFKLAKDNGIDIRVGENYKAEKKEKPKNETSKFVVVERYLDSHFDFRYNEVANEIEGKEKNESLFKAINENNIFRHLQHQNISFSINYLTALLRSDFVPVFNPLKKYFETLPVWDCKTDYISKLCSFITAKEQGRFNLHFKKMLVRCIACGLERAFNKQAFILMGGQSSGKTTFVRWLCPKQLETYYTEAISTDKDFLISLSENFIINLDELATLQKFELNALKSMLSKDAVKIRRPYDKKPSLSKRRANFFGSTNKEEFLSDETGTVRWLCFELLRINWEYKTEIDIDFVWAQAYYLFKSGFKFELTPGEIEENETINARHQQRTAEIELLQTHFEPSEKGKPLAEAFTATDIINRLNGSATTQIKLSVQNVGKALKLLGIPQVSERIEGNIYPKKVYWLKFIPVTTPTTNS